MLSDTYSMSESNLIPESLFGTNKVSDNIFASLVSVASVEALDKNLVVNLEEDQYLDLLRNILNNGTWALGRNGRTKSIFGHSMRFSLANGKIPILTTKKTAWKTCLKELLWFIRGETDNKLLQDQGVHIWDDNSSREFLDSRGLYDNPEGILGPIYGFQWRHFNAPYDNRTGKLLSDGDSGIDQLQQIIDQLKDPEQRNSRRLIMTAWNPCQLDQKCLPPCHILCQFNVHDGNKLSCALYQRSVDTALGQPFNIASYSFLTHLLAKHCGLEAYEFVYFMGNSHIYEEHIEPINEIFKRNPFPFPTVSIKEVKEKIDDYLLEDFVVTGYQHHEAIKFRMVA
jgi:thymidylate synthase